MGPEGWAPKGGAPKGRALKGGAPPISSFFPPPALRGILVVFEAPGD